MLSFAGFRIGPLDFVVLEAEQVEAFDLSCMFRANLSQYCFDPLSREEKFPYSCRQVRRIGEGVDQRELTRIIEQCLLVMLAVMSSSKGVSSRKAETVLGWLLM